VTERAKAASRSPETTCDLTDEEFERRLDDPSLIETHDEALGIIREVMANIASIDMQIEVYRGEVEISGHDTVSPDRHAWYRKALFARAFRRQEIDRVYKRDKELRGVTVSASSAKDRKEGAAKQQRLQAEAEERRVAQQLKAETHRQATAQAERGGLRKHFLDAARDGLIPEMFEAIMADAQARRSARLLEEV
jgi:hypothetical protein